MSKKLVVDKELKVEGGGSLTASGSNTEVKASHLNVRDGASITIQSGSTLKLTDSESTRSQVLGTVEVAGTLTITHNHAILGDSSGEIKLVNGKIGESGMPATDVLTIEGNGSTRASSLTVHGYGDIHVALMNKAFVVADVNAQDLDLITHDKDSTTAGHWMAEGGPTATLYAQCDAEVKGGGWWKIIDTSDTSDIRGRIWVDSCCDELSGEVVNKNGEICLANNFCTTGDLTLESVLVSGYASEPYIHVKKQALAHFKAAAGCAGATCPYCP